MEKRGKTPSPAAPPCLAAVLTLHRRGDGGEDGGRHPGAAPHQRQGRQPAAPRRHGAAPRPPGAAGDGGEGAALRAALRRPGRAGEGRGEAGGRVSPSVRRGAFLRGAPWLPPGSSLIVLPAMSRAPDASVGCGLKGSQHSLMRISDTPGFGFN